MYDDTLLRRALDSEFFGLPTYTILFLFALADVITCSATLCLLRMTSVTLLQSTRSSPPHNIVDIIATCVFNSLLYSPTIYPAYVHLHIWTPKRCYCIITRFHKKLITWSTQKPGPQTFPSLRYSFEIYMYLRSSSRSHFRVILSVCF